MKTRFFVASLLLFFLCFSSNFVNAGCVNALPISVTWEPEIPLPNSTIKFVVVCEATALQIQFCLNGICGFPKAMNFLGNDTFEYFYVPGNENPYTSNNDNLSFEILKDGEEVYSSWLIIRENAKPVIENLEIWPENPRPGENITITANVSDDLGIKEVFCNLSAKNESWVVQLLPKESHYTANFTLPVAGEYFIVLIATDNSNQKSFKNTTFFVYPREQTDKTPPRIIDAFGIATSETEMWLKVYLSDDSGIAEAGVFINNSFFPLEHTQPGIFTAHVPRAKAITIYARDPYNNTINQSYELNIYAQSSEQSQQNPLEPGTIASALLIGILVGLAIVFLVKSQKLLSLILLCLLALCLLLSIQQGFVEKSLDAGGNIYNGNTCWSCLALQPKFQTTSWLTDYPNGTPVKHPQWVLEKLSEGKPVLLYVHQVPCTGCEIQWNDMIRQGIITQDGKMAGRFEGKISFTVLDVTMGSETREQGMEVLKTYTLGSVLGTPTTVCLVKSEGKVHWWSKAGVVYSAELSSVLDEALHMMHG